MLGKTYFIKRYWIVLEQLRRYDGHFVAQEGRALLGVGGEEARGQPLHAAPVLRRDGVPALTKHILTQTS